MKCKECINEGKKSRISPGFSTVTAMYCSPYYDEDGNYHNHNSNTTTTEYGCSNGHHWTDRTSGQPCVNCDWGHDQ